MRTFETTVDDMVPSLQSASEEGWCYREHNSGRGGRKIEMDRFLRMRKLSPDERSGGWDEFGGEGGRRRSCCCR